MSDAPRYEEDPVVVVLERPSPVVISDPQQQVDEVTIVADALPPVVVLPPPAPDPSIVTISAGPKGDTGPRGPTGPSAYDQAVLEGFVGTPEEWLASLQAPPGSVTPDDLEAHVHDETPHPVYDDLPAFDLLFDNRLV